MMIFGLFVVFVALAISGVAAYYSIYGLTAIFAAAVIPVIIMGAVLEVGKIVTTVWLHQYWFDAKKWMRMYLAAAVIIIMFITSMGIFGFLSKAHIEQTAQSEENQSQLVRIESEIERFETIIARSELKIIDAENQDDDTDARIQSQISTEEERINNAYDRQQPAIDQQQSIIDSELGRINEAFERIQPAIEEQNAIIEREEQKLRDTIQPYSDEIALIDDKIIKLETWPGEGKIKEVQSLIGVNTDGKFGYATKNALKIYKENLTKRRLEVLAEINKIKDDNKFNYTIVQANKEKQRLRETAEAQQAGVDNTIIEKAREEIKRLRGIAEEEIRNANEVITRLRSQLGQGTTDVADAIIEEQLEKIKESNDKIDVLIDEKFDIQKQYRKLEAEVGPIKYIAEFIYGEKADTELLERAVRWVIIIIVLVFDPLAIMLVLAGVQTVAWARQQKGYIPYHPPKGPIPTKPNDDLKKRQSKRERELEMKIQEHTDLLLQLEEQLDGAIASGKMTKAELASLQKEHDNLAEAKSKLEEEYSDLQKKRMKLTS
jgi:chromosome segregation ATPase